MMQESFMWPDYTLYLSVRMTLLIILCAKYLVWVVVAAGALVLLLSPHRMRIVPAALSLALAYALGKLAGFAWFDPRPFTLSGTAPLIPHAADNGFPSDHMLLAATVASIVFAYNRALGAALWILALLVGFSRVAAGIHHVADIAGSAAV